MFLRICLLTTICHCVLSFPNIPEDPQSIKLQNLGGNQYFQATQQIFYGCKNNDTKPNEESKVKVPADYVVTPGIGAHKFHLEKLNWNLARNVCVKEGAHLAIINSEAEENLIKKWVIEKNLDEAWLGYHEQFQKGDWVTALDQPMSSGYVHWKTGEPNNLGGVEHCVTYMQNGAGMNDKNCITSLAFVCKIYLN